MSGDTPKGKRPARRRSPKSDRLQLEQRLRNVEERLLMGLTSAEVVNELSSRHNSFCNKVPELPCTRHLGISVRQAKTYISRVHKRLRAATSEHDSILRDQMIALAFRCYQGAFASRDFNGAANIIMKIARLTGIIEPPPPPQIVQLMAALPSDRDRFPTDANYQTQAALRDMLMAKAAKGDKRAAEAAATIAATLVDSYGSARAGLTNEAEADIVATVRAKLVSRKHFPEGVMAPIEAFDKDGKQIPAIDDFKSLETVGKKDRPE